MRRVSQSASCRFPSPRYDSRQLTTSISMITHHTVVSTNAFSCQLMRAAARLRIEYVDSE